MFLLAGLVSSLNRVPPMISSSEVATGNLDFLFEGDIIVRRQFSETTQIRIASRFEKYSNEAGYNATNQPTELLTKYMDSPS